MKMKLYIRKVRLMNLVEIKQETCPICGARAVRETQCSKYYNGHYNESRLFDCGYEIEFSPNFMRMRATGKCRKDPLEIERSNRQKKVLTSLRDHINTLELDQGVKTFIVGSFNHLI